MDNEAIAVKCSRHGHGPQIARQCQSSNSNYCRRWERSGRMHHVTRKINY